MKPQIFETKNWKTFEGEFFKIYNDSDGQERLTLLKNSLEQLTTFSHAWEQFTEIINNDIKNKKIKKEPETETYATNIVTLMNNFSTILNNINKNNGIELKDADMTYQVIFKELLEGKRWLQRYEKEIEELFFKKPTFKNNEILYKSIAEIFQTKPYEEIIHLYLGALLIAIDEEQKIHIEKNRLKNSFFKKVVTDNKYLRTAILKHAIKAKKEVDNEEEILGRISQKSKSFLQEDNLPIKKCDGLDSDFSIAKENNSLINFTPQKMKEKPNILPNSSVGKDPNILSAMNFLLDEKIAAVTAKERALLEKEIFNKAKILKKITDQYFDLINTTLKTEIAILFANNIINSYYSNIANIIEKYDDDEKEIRSEKMILQQSLVKKALTFFQKIDFIPKDYISKANLDYNKILEAIQNKQFSNWRSTAFIQLNFDFQQYKNKGKKEDLLTTFNKSYYLNKAIEKYFPFYLVYNNGFFKEETNCAKITDKISDFHHSYSTLLEELFDEFIEDNGKTIERLTAIRKSLINASRTTQFFAENSEFSFISQIKLLMDYEKYNFYTNIKDITSHEYNKAVAEKKGNNITEQLKKYKILLQNPTLKENVSPQWVTLAKEYLEKIKTISTLSSDSNQEKNKQQEWERLKKLMRLIELRSISPTPVPNISLEELRNKLDDLYGLTGAKENLITEYARKYGNLISKTNGNKNRVKSQNFICFTGKPGLGKTTLAKKYGAAITGKRVTTINLSRIKELSDLQGINFWYNNANSGKLTDFLLEGSTVWLFDEVDKLNTNQEAIKTFLLQITDPEQNFYHDDYLNIDIHLENITIIFTANNLETLPSPLIDRIHEVKIEDYSKDEIKEIFKTKIIPKLLKEHTLDEKVEFDDSAITEIITYSNTQNRSQRKTSGIRNTEQTIKIIIGQIMIQHFQDINNDEKINVNNKLIISKDNYQKYTLSTNRKYRNNELKAIIPNFEIIKAQTIAKRAYVKSKLLSYLKHPINSNLVFNDIIDFNEFEKLKNLIQELITTHTSTLQLMAYRNEDKKDSEITEEYDLFRLANKIINNHKLKALQGVTYTDTSTISHHTSTTHTTSHSESKTKGTSINSCSAGAFFSLGYNSSTTNTTGYNTSEQTGSTHSHTFGLISYNIPVTELKIITSILETLNTLKDNQKQWDFYTQNGCYFKNYRKINVNNYTFPLTNNEIIHILYSKIKTIKFMLTEFAITPKELSEIITTILTNIKILVTNMDEKTNSNLQDITAILNGLLKGSRPHSTTLPKLDFHPLDITQIKTITLPLQSTLTCFASDDGSSITENTQSLTPYGLALKNQESERMMKKPPIDFQLLAEEALNGKTSTNFKPITAEKELPNKRSLRY